MAKQSFLDEYRAYARRVTDAPYIFHDIMAYGVLGVACGNRWKYRYFGGSWLTPHLWILLLAQSSTFHKSEAIKVARRCLAKLSERFLTWNGSHRSLVEQFAAKEQGVLFATEFEQFLGTLNQNYLSGGRGMFTDLYDGELSGSVFKVSGEQHWKDNLAISFFAGSTPEQLGDWLKERDVAAGLLPRFILVHAAEQEQQFALPLADDGQDDVMLRHLQDRLVGYAATRGEMTITPGAHKLYESWFRRVGQIPLDSTRADPWKTRLATVGVKLAMLNQIAEDSKPKIGEKAMYDATTVTDTLLAHVAKVCQTELALSRFEEQAKRLKFILQKYGPGASADGWLEWSFVLPHMKVSADELRKVAGTLEESHQVEWQHKRPQRLRLFPRDPGQEG